MPPIKEKLKSKVKKVKSVKNSKKEIASHECCCELCGRMFKSQKNLNVHILEQHSKTIRKLKCPLCEYLSPRKTNIRKHFTETHGTSKSKMRTLAKFEGDPKYVMVKNESE